MTIYVALLRAVNVGGTGRLPMAVLREVCGALADGPVRTHLQSGNAVFAGAVAPEALARGIGEGVEAACGFHPQVLLRTAAELADVVRLNPFSADEVPDPARRLVMFLAAAPPPAAWEALLQAHAGPEAIRPGGREAYLYYPDGMGRSKLTGTVLEKRLGTPGTARNWNTVTALLALARELGAP